MKIVSGRSENLHTQRAKLINEKLYDSVYLASFGRKVIKLRFDLFDASLVRRLAQQTILTYFSSTQLEFGSSHEKFGVWTRPNSAYIRILKSDPELACSRAMRQEGILLFNSCMSPAISR